RGQREWLPDDQRCRGGDPVDRYPQRRDANSCRGHHSPVVHGGHARVAAAVRYMRAGQIDERLVVVDRRHDVVRGGVRLLERGVGVGRYPRVLAGQVQLVAGLEDRLVRLDGYVLDMRGDRAADGDRTRAGAGDRVGADPELVGAVVDDLLERLLVPLAQVRNLDCQGDVLGVPGGQHFGPLEARQLLLREFGAGHGELRCDVQLRHGGAGDRAGIGDVEVDVHGAVGAYVFRRDVDVRIREAGVRQPVPERIGGGAGEVQVR